MHAFFCTWCQLRPVLKEWKWKMWQGSAKYEKSLGLEMSLSWRKCLDDRSSCFDALGATQECSSIPGILHSVFLGLMDYSGALATSTWESLCHYSAEGLCLLPLVFIALQEIQVPVGIFKRESDLFMTALPIWLCFMDELRLQSSFLEV